MEDTRNASIKSPTKADFTVLKKNMSPERAIEAYPGGIVVSVDKPLKWTSADVVRKVKFAAIRHFRKKNLKVGHSGTLDPLATGVLLMCIGPATKRAEEIQAHLKEYVFDIIFGATTPSYDREQPIDKFHPYEHITEELLRKALEGFVGEQEQVAPLFSAKSVDGKRAYELARKMYRKGEALDDAAKQILKASPIRIEEIELLGFKAPGDGDFENLECFRGTSPLSERLALSSSSRRISRYVVEDENALPKARIRVVCTKGTYIRALSRDIGEALGSGAFLSDLRRSKSGAFNVEEALSINDIDTIFSNDNN